MLHIAKQIENCYYYVVKYGTTWARGVVGLTRLPVTEEIAGSNPVEPAIKKSLPSGDDFFIDRLVCDANW